MSAPEWMDLFDDEAMSPPQHHVYHAPQLSFQLDSSTRRSSDASTVGSPPQQQFSPPPASIAPMPFRNKHVYLPQNLPPQQSHQQPLPALPQQPQQHHPSSVIGLMPASAPATFDAHHHHQHPQYHYPLSQRIVHPQSQSPTTDSLQDEKRRRRRQSHNLVERRRRDNINERITELAELLPESFLDPANLRASLPGSGSASPKGPIEPTELASSPTSLSMSISSTLQLTPQQVAQAHASAKPNKGVVLTKSVEYIRCLQQVVDAQAKRITELEDTLKLPSDRSLGDPSSNPLRSNTTTNMTTSSSIDNTDSSAANILSLLHSSSSSVSDNHGIAPSQLKEEAPASLASSFTTFPSNTFFDSPTSPSILRGTAVADSSDSTPAGDDMHD